jgi:hypothetical protein
MTGQQLQDAIVEAAHLAGFRAAHFAPARTQHGWRTPARYDAKGFPDLVLVGDRVVFVEVKGAGDRLSADQVQWVAALLAAEAEAHVWGSEDWTSGRIDEVLGLKAVTA